MLRTFFGAMCGGMLGWVCVGFAESEVRHLKDFEIVLAVWIWGGAITGAIIALSSYFEPSKPAP